MNAEFNSSGGIAYQPEHFKVGDGEIVLLGLHEIKTIMQKFGEKLGKKLMRRVLNNAAQITQEYLQSLTVNHISGKSHKTAQGYVSPSGTLYRSIGIKAARNRGSSVPAVWVGFRYGRRYPNNKNAWYRHFVEWGTQERFHKKVIFKGLGVRISKKVDKSKSVGSMKGLHLMERSWEATKMAVQQNMIDGMNELITMEWKGINK